MVPLEFEIPTLHLAALTPVLVILGAACMGVLVEALVPREWRNAVQASIALVAIVASLVTSILNFRLDERRIIAGADAFVTDGPTLFVWWILLVCGGLAMLMFAERTLHGDRSAFAAAAVTVPGSPEENEAVVAKQEHTEVWPLALFALAGMMLFVAANDLLMLFIALEVMSLPLYLLSGLARRRRLLSQEAALKYFLLGALSSAVLLMGVALLYGFTGGMSYREVAASLGTSAHGHALLLTSIALIVVGMLFKVGAVPFHSWVPDVYQGSPTPVTAFMAAGTKAAAVGALMRFLFVAVGGARWDWQPLVAAVAALTIVVGTVMAVRQTDVKRLLAYSSVAHAGFILAALVGASTVQSGLPENQLGSTGAVLFYLAAYGLATVAAFAMVTVIRHAGGESTSIASWNGIGRRHPLLGVAFTILLLSFAGIPLTSGFIGKLSVFLAAWRGGFEWLVVLAVLMSVVAAYFYVKIVVAMFFGDTADDEVKVVRAGAGTWIPIGVGLLGTVVLGLYPGPLMDMAMRASEFLR